MTLAVLTIAAFGPRELGGLLVVLAGMLIGTWWIGLRAYFALLEHQVSLEDRLDELKRELELIRRPERGAARPSAWPK